MLQNILAKLRNPQTLKLSLAAIAAAWGSATLASYASEKTSELQELDQALELRRTQLELAEQQFINAAAKVQAAGVPVDERPRDEDGYLQPEND